MEGYRVYENSYETDYTWKPRSVVFSNKREAYEEARHLRECNFADAEVGLYDSRFRVEVRKEQIDSYDWKNSGLYDVG
jgi:hypothetical protein